MYVSGMPRNAEEAPRTGTKTKSRHSSQLTRGRLPFRMCTKSSHVLLRCWAELCFSSTTGVSQPMLSSGRERLNCGRELPPALLVTQESSGFSSAPNTGMFVVSSPPQLACHVQFSTSNGRGALQQRGPFGLHFAAVRPMVI